MYCVLFATHTRWQNDISIHGRYWNRSSGDSYNLCFESWIFKHVISLLRFMLMFWIFVSPFKCALYDNSLNGVAFLRLHEADGNFERYFILVMTTKLNLHQTIYLLERHCRFEESKVDFEFLSWVVGRLGVYHLRLVRWGRCQKSKECHSHWHRCWLLWTPLGWQYALMLRLLSMAEPNVGSNYNLLLQYFFWFALNSINSGEEVRFSPFQIRAAHSKNSRRLGAKAFRWVKAKKSLHSRKGDQIFRSSP